jgi:hypothetical protein
MGTRFIPIAFAAVALIVGSASRSSAGSDMVIDTSAQAPPPQVYNYAPPPPPVYYAPPPVAVVVRPAYGYYSHPVRAFGFHHWDRRHIHHTFFHGR